MRLGRAAGRLYANAEKAMTMSTFTAPSIEYERPVWVGGQKGPGGAHGEPWAAPESAPPAASLQAPVWRSIDVLEENARFTRSAFGSLAQSFTDTLLLWTVLMFALLFGMSGLWLALEANQQTKAMARRWSQFDGVIPKMASLGESVDALASELSQRKSSEEVAREGLQRSELKVEASVGSLAERLDHFIEESQGREAASELRLDRLEAERAVAQTSSATFRPDDAPPGPERGRSLDDALQGLQLRGDSPVTPPPNSGVVSAAALAQMEGLAPPLANEGTAVSSKPSKPARHRRRGTRLTGAE